jgi:hypothetical protein
VSAVAVQPGASAPLGATVSREGVAIATRGTHNAERFRGRSPLVRIQAEAQALLGRVLAGAAR